MKIFQPKTSASRGSILVMTIVLTAIIGFTLATYLTLIGAQNRSVVRSQTWNATIPLIEAGIEEAMAHLNKNGITNLFTDGWRNQYGYAIRKRTLGEGRYTVAITPTSRPVIECTGYLPTPILFSSSGLSFFAQSGSTTYFNKKSYINRTVRVTTGGGALFAKGMVAKGAIDFNGNNVSTDSFDSADPNYSNGGRYDNSKRKDNGDVATNSGEAGMFAAGNANIMGKVATGPGGSVSVGANGVVGSYAWVMGGNKGIQTGYFSDDMNMSFPEITVPFSGGFTPPSGNVSVTNITYGTGLVTVVSLPSPLPPGSITTNYGLVTTETYPSPVPPGGVITNLVTKNSTLYPTNAIGPVTTNTMLVTTDTLPNPIPPEVVKIVTNITWTTNATLPSPTPLGTIQTNTVLASAQCPLDPMPAGPPTPPPNWTPPAPGTYVGNVTNRYVSSGGKDGRGWWHDYQAIQSYAYQSRVYSLTYANAYSYKDYTYSYNVPQSYTYSTLTTNSVTVTTERFDYVLDNGDYKMSSLSGTVYVRGKARLYVTGDIQFTGHDGITIGPNGSLTLYMGGAQAKIAGKGVVNATGKAQNFMYYGLKSNTALDLSGNGEFVGVIYAPDADFYLRGGGNNTEDFVGASVTGSVKMNGHFNFHYDEDLARSGPRSRYTITSWNEVGTAEAKILQNQDWVFLEDQLDDGGAPGVIY